MGPPVAMALWFNGPPCKWSGVERRAILLKSCGVFFVEVNIGCGVEELYVACANTKHLCLQQQQ